MPKYIYSILLLMLVWCGSACGAPRLADYQETYQEHKQTLAATFREKRLALPVEHVQGLRRLEHRFRKNGDTLALMEVQQERRRFVLDPHAAAIPDIQSPAELAQLCNQYRRQFMLLAQTKQAQTARLNTQYISVLQQLERDLLNKGDDAGARRVADARQMVAANKRQPAPQADPFAQPQAQPPAPAQPSQEPGDGQATEKRAGDAISVDLDAIELDDLF